MIECVCLENNHLFNGNPLYSQHQLRYRSIIERQNWDVPTINDAEYDTYDNPSAHYLVKRDPNGRAIGSSRLCPTDRPYMLQEAFPHLVTNTDMPDSYSVWEGSRFCIDKNLPPEHRRKIIQEIVIAYLEFSIAKNIEKIIGVMYPIYWKNIFIKSGWDVEWMGDVHKSAEGYKIQAGSMNATQANLERVRDITNIHYPILNFGHIENTKIAVRAA